MNMADYFLFMIVLPALVIVRPQCVSSLTYCFKGSYEVIPENGGTVCLLCPEGTFMPYYDHRFKECFKCTEIVDPSLEILISPCTDIHDAVIHCIPGYYRRLGRNPRERARCEKCTKCEYPIVPCRTYEDTHCCLGDHFIVYPDRNGVPLCWETYWLCRRGHYFDTDSSSCEPCPTGTFMSLDYHSMTECWPCQTPSELHHLPKHAAIIQECNSTHPPIIGCKDGFYTDHEHGYQGTDIGCSPCTVCNSTDQMYEGKACDRFQDTVCCPQPDMIVVDTPEGMRCEADNEPVLGTEIDFNDSQMDETSKASSNPAVITTEGSHENLDDSGAELQCENFSHLQTIAITVAATSLVFMILGIIMFRRQLLSSIKSRILNFSLNAGPNADSYERGEANHLLSDERDNPETVFEESLPEECEAHLKGFKLSDSDYKRLMELLDNEMDKGLKKKSHEKADVKMYPTFVRSLPDGSESGEFLGMEWGSIRIRLLYMRLQGGEMDIRWKRTDTIPAHIKSGNQLFDFIAGCTKKFIADLKLADRELPLGWSVSFPCCHTTIDRATLTRVTKEFSCEDVVGKDINQLLQEKLNRKECKVKTVAIVNDVVSAMMSGDPDCHIGMTMGRGYNVCYMEDVDNVETLDDVGVDGPLPRQVVINTELGALGDNICLDFIRTEYDRQVDRGSLVPGQQRMEKMVSGIYLGEIVRHVLVKLVKQRLLFKSLHNDHLLFKEGSFTYEYMSKIESDPEGVYQKTKRVLEDMKLGITYTEKDCKIVKHVCTLVINRAVVLAATALATLINRMNKSKVTIAMDGFLYKLHPRIQNLLRQMMEKLVKKPRVFKLQEADGGSAIGAALAAAVAVRLNNAASQ